MATKSKKERRHDISTKLLQIYAQLERLDEYPFDLEKLEKHLGAAVQGRFGKLADGWPTWKSIKLGAVPCNQSKFSNLLKSSGHRIEKTANFMIEQIKEYTGPVLNLDLAVASGLELGFSYNPTFKEICERADMMGLETCPAELGPLLRWLLYFQDQGPDNALHLAMEPIEDHGGTPRVFRLKREVSTYWLDSARVSFDLVFEKEGKWIFVKNKNLEEEAKKSF